MVMRNWSMTSARSEAPDDGEAQCCLSVSVGDEICWCRTYRNEKLESYRERRRNKKRSDPTRRTLKKQFKRYAFYAECGEERHLLGKSAHGGVRRCANSGGVFTHPFVLRSWLRANCVLRSRDCVVVSYPKCGTTLAEQIVLLLLNGGDACVLDPLSKNAANASSGGTGKVWPEACLRPDDQQSADGARNKEEFIPMTLQAFDTMPSPRVVKTHALPRDVLGDPTARAPLVPGVPYVLLTRNPLDACVSGYYHAWSTSSSVFHPIHSSGTAARKSISILVVWDIYVCV